MPITVKARWRWGFALASLLATAVGVMGFLHTPTGRALWAQKTQSACPFGGKAAAELSPQQMDAQMRSQNALLRGAQPSKQKPALGFTFLVTDTGAFTHFVEAAGGRCIDRGQGLSLECANVSLDALEDAHLHGRGTLFARFDAEHKLREIVAMASLDSPQNAVGVLDAVVDKLSQMTGPPSSTRGDRSAAYLAGGSLRQTAAEFRFSDYFASVSATNMASQSYNVIQKYKSLAD